MKEPEVSDSGCYVSVIAPAYNEEENLGALATELEKALLETGRPFEIVIVDDGSTDKSREVLARLVESKPCVKAVFMKRNSGQSAATVAGFRSAAGDVVFTIDADLQNNPADIPRMLKLLEETGADSVCGIRAKRQDDAIRRMSSKIANRVRRWCLGDELVDTGCALKCFRRPFVSDLPCFNGLHRFLGVMLELQGARVKQMEVDHRPRTRGVSKYGLSNRLWRGIRDLFGVRWLRVRWVKAEIAEVLTAKHDAS